VDNVLRMLDVANNVYTTYIHVDIADMNLVSIL